MKFKDGTLSKNNQINYLQREIKNLEITNKNNKKNLFIPKNNNFKIKKSNNYKNLNHNYNFFHNIEQKKDLKVLVGNSFNYNNNSNDIGYNKYNQIVHTNIITEEGKIKNIQILLLITL